MRKILIYTVHKAASMFLHKLTSQVANALMIDYFSINDDKYYDVIMKESWNSLIEDEAKTGCFGPIRAGEAKPSFPKNLKSYSVILHLRDPRDVLTSSYFSVTYSHPIQAGRFNPTDEHRKQWEREGIDKYVTGQIPNFKHKYQELCLNLLGKENVVFLKYENMISDYKRWLKHFLSAFTDFIPPQKKYLGIDSHQNTFSRIHKKLYKENKNDFKVSSENIYNHKRQAIPGDYKRKLTPQTIDILNSQFAEVLTLLRYGE